MVFSRTRIFVPKPPIALNPPLLLTPPFTQLNTPYPATAYLKGYLNTLGVDSHQADLGIEVILRLFCREGLAKVFAEAAQKRAGLSPNSQRILSLQASYLHTIDPVISFLQHKNPTLAHAIADRQWLPEAARFDQLDDLDWAFGAMGTHDRARHYATLYLEDLGDLIAEAVDPHFGFSRYAERLGRSASHFDELYEALLAPETLVTQTLTDLLEEKIRQWEPGLVCLSVPFPGNLFGALKCGQYIRQRYPHIPVALGGGFANTELRSLREPRLFEFIDYVSLDDGEAPLTALLDHLRGGRARTALKRMYAREADAVKYYNGAREKDVAQREVGTPDYADLPLNDYLSVIEIVNPMHRLWSDGRWNKLTLAHGCYWGKCAFCDISLDYIQRYEPVTAEILCDRMQTLIAQTGQNGFHFVDEAAPPALMRDLALEILRRGMTVVWWTNIRFETSFTPDICRLLKASGCIAVSGGLEVASDRLLALMKKGVTVAQVARVAAAFTDAGIMVHAYLMYGFPTQTAQETIDSLEMVRQLFEQGVVQSGFWHQFAMTSHSPVGLHPEAYGVMKVGPVFGGFADNDCFHEDPQGADHERYAAGLRKSLFNYMHGVGFDLPLAEWFDFRTPRTTVAPDYIAAAISTADDPATRPNARVVWLGEAPVLEWNTLKAGDITVRLARLVFYLPREVWVLETSSDVGSWLADALAQIQAAGPGARPLAEWQAGYEAAGMEDFRSWFFSPQCAQLRQKGLLVL